MQRELLAQENHWLVHHISLRVHAALISLDEGRVQSRTPPPPRPPAGKADQSPLPKMCAVLRPVAVARRPLSHWVTNQKFPRGLEKSKCNGFRESRQISAWRDRGRGMCARCRTIAHAMISCCMSPTSDDIAMDPRIPTHTVPGFCRMLHKSMWGGRGGGSGLFKDKGIV